MAEESEKIQEVEKAQETEKIQDTEALGADQNGAFITQQQVKSIVYGDPLKNKYGTFWCFCASLSDSSQVSSIVDYIKTSESYKELEFFAYAYRLCQELIEMSDEDDKIAGAGQKILHLLQKFYVENALLIVGVALKDTFALVTPECYHTIVERAKDLLSSLYDRVVDTQKLKGQMPQQRQQQAINWSQSNNKWQVKPKTQTLDPFSLIPPTKSYALKSELAKVDRRQYFLENGQKPLPRFLASKDSDKELISLKMLRENLERNTAKIEAIRAAWTQNDFLQMKFTVNYENSPQLERVFKVLMILEDIPTFKDLQKNYDFQQRLPNIMEMQITPQKAKKINSMLREDRNLNPRHLSKVNQNVAILMEYLITILKRYDLSQQIFEHEYKQYSRQAAEQGANDLGKYEDEQDEGNYGEAENEIEVLDEEQQEQLYEQLMQPQHQQQQYQSQQQQQMRIPEKKPTQHQRTQKVQQQQQHPQQQLQQKQYSGKAEQLESSSSRNTLSVRGDGSKTNLGISINSKKVPDNLGQSVTSPQNQQPQAQELNNRTQNKKTATKAADTKGAPGKAITVTNEKELADNSNAATKISPQKQEGSKPTSKTSTATKTNVKATKGSTVGKSFGTDSSENALKESNDNVQTHPKETDSLSDKSFATKLLQEGRSHDTIELKQNDLVRVSFEGLPTDVEGIKEYLKTHDMDEMPKEHLEFFAEILKQNRIKIESSK